MRGHHAPARGRLEKGRRARPDRRHGRRLRGQCQDADGTVGTGRRVLSGLSRPPRRQRDRRGRHCPAALPAPRLDRRRCQGRQAPAHRKTPLPQPRRGRRHCRCRPGERHHRHGRAQSAVLSDGAQGQGNDRHGRPGPDLCRQHDGRRGTAPSIEPRQVHLGQDGRTPGHLALRSGQDGRRRAHRHRIPPCLPPAVPRRTDAGGSVGGAGQLSYSDE